MGTLSTLDAFAAAWNRGDLDEMMTFVADDCVFLASFGPEVDGTAFRGRAEVRAGFARFLDRFPGGSYERTAAIVDGDRAFVAWTFSHPTADGAATWRGCDHVELAAGKIVKKDAFRKERSAAV